MLSPKARIQIVEDEFIIAEDLRGALEDIGHEVLGVAESYQEALEHFEAKRADLVLLDINLEGNAEGIKLGEVLNEKRIPFIYISAYIDAKTREAAERTNPKAFMVKPFDFAELEVQIKFAIGPDTSLLNTSSRKKEF